MKNVLSIKVPAINDSFYNESSTQLIRKKIEDVIKQKYGTIIDNISKITNVPSELIISFIFIESSGNEKAETPYAVGLMQVGTATASDTIVKEKSFGRLNKEEENLLKKYLSKEIWNEIEKLKPKQKSLGKTFVTREMLFNPEFNILVGTILLGQLIDEFTENNNLRLDKIVVIYNRGRYDKVSKEVIAFKGNTQEMEKIVPKGTYDYVKKLIGKNGVLDILV
jgi:soluble lytic murein transglycosylase-like protein